MVYNIYSNESCHLENMLLNESIRVSNYRKNSGSIGHEMAEAASLRETAPLLLLHMVDELVL